MIPCSAGTARTRHMATISRLGRYCIENYFVATVMALTITIFCLTCPNFFSIGNLLDITKQGGLLSLLALAMTMVLIVGGMDMSVGAIYDICTNFCAGMISSGFGVFAAVALSAMAGIGFGVFNMIMITFVRVPPFIATVGTMFVVTGLTFAYNGGQSILLSRQPLFFSLAQGSTLGIPNMAFIVAAVTAIIYFCLRRFRFGLYMYATGGNPMAARAAGISTTVAQLIAYGMSGFLSGFGGVLAASYISGSFALGSPFEFLITAFAAAFLGSTLIRRGELNPLGTVIAALFITSLNNALTLYDVSFLILPGMQGAVLILALVLGNWGRREIGQMTIF